MIDLPLIGEIKLAGEIGYSGVSHFRWSACPKCGKERWIRFSSLPPRLCFKCATRTYYGDKSANWRGGRVKLTGGYIGIYLSKDDSFAPMLMCEGYVREHRLVMAKYLGRCLQDQEIVHHKNGIKDDNRLENLELTCSLGEHSKNHSQGYQDGYRKGFTDGQSRQIKQLKLEITKLRARK